jgi:DNA ligase-1
LVEQFFAISKGISSFIVDAEIVAINASGSSLKSFQELSNRARKDVKLHEIKVPVCVYAFDLMYLNGQVSALQPHIRIFALITIWSLMVVTPPRALS